MLIPYGGAILEVLWAYNSFKNSFTDILLLCSCVVVVFFLFCLFVFDKS